MASKSKEIKFKRRKNWLLVPLVYLVFAALAFFLGKQKNIALTFSILAGVWLVLHPLYTRWNYKDKFKKAIIKNNKEIFGKKISLNIQDNFLIISDTVNTTKQKLSEVSSIHEITSHIFIKLKKGSSIIIPKSDLNNTSVFLDFISNISKGSKVKISKELTWKWK
jgi:hypothetical protein